MALRAAFHASADGRGGADGVLTDECRYFLLFVFLLLLSHVWNLGFSQRL